MSAANDWQGQLAGWQGQLAGTLRFHIDPRGRILMENVTRACLEVARALAPEDPALRDLLARAQAADQRRRRDGRA